LEKNLALLAKFEAMAREKNATPAQLALAWLMAQGKDVIPIPSNKTRAHLEENIKATEIKLSPEDLARLDAIFPPGVAAGPRTKDMHRVNV
jgi:aryl-alcohol dehydrogenase-like predicted oxidoreductase